MRKFLFLTIFLAFFFLFSSPALATEKKFYLGLYGHDGNYYVKSGFNATLFVYNLWRFENEVKREEVDNFFTNFPKRPSYRIILEWLFYEREDVDPMPANPKEVLCAGSPAGVEPPFKDFWWVRTKEMINYYHGKDLLKNIWGITLGEETWYCPKNLGYMYNKTRNLLDRLGYGKDSDHYIRVLQWPAPLPKWFKAGAPSIWQDYLKNLPADGYVIDYYGLSADDLELEINEYRKYFPDRPVIPVVAYTWDPRWEEDIKTPCKDGYCCNGCLYCDPQCVPGQKEMIDRLFAQHGNPDTIIFYIAGHGGVFYYPSPLHTSQDKKNWQDVLEYANKEASCCFNYSWADLDFNGKVNQKDLKLMARYFYEYIDLIGDGNSDFYLNSLDFVKARNLVGN